MRARTKPREFYDPGMPYTELKERQARALAFRVRVGAARQAAQLAAAAPRPTWNTGRKVKPYPRASGRLHRRRAW